MSTLIHLLRLKRIESEIQHQIYRVDKIKSPQEIYAETNNFLKSLLAWKNVIPRFETQTEMPENQVYLSYDSYVRYLALYYQSTGAFFALFMPRQLERY